MESTPRRLDQLPVGSRAELGPPILEPARCRRLAELGLRPGAQVTVLSRTPGGGRVLAVEDARIALDRAILRRIPAEPVSC